MPNCNVIDFESLLSPINDDRPQGIDIREDRTPSSEYYTVKDARNGARAAERANVFAEDHNSDAMSLWRKVYSVAPKILQTSSKDLEIACWYLEALIRLEGLVGLRDGISLIEQLIEQYWGNLYPTPDEDGLETKVSPLAGLNGDGAEGTLLTPIRNCIITAEGSQGEFSFWQYQQARAASQISDDDERKTRIESLGFSLDTIDNTLKETDIQFYIDLIDDLDRTLNSYKSINARLREHCGNEAPPHKAISELIDELIRTVRFMNQDRLNQLKTQEKISSQQETSSVNTSNPEQGNVVTLNQGRASMGSSGPIQNREDALLRLKEVADFFRIYEPHTPLAPSLDRLIEWGRMPITELMLQLLPNNDSRNLYAQLTGVKLDGSAQDTYIAPPPTPQTKPISTKATTDTPSESASKISAQQNKATSEQSKETSW